jgi:hypothetical protein
VRLALGGLPLASEDGKLGPSAPENPLGVRTLIGVKLSAWLAQRAGAGHPVLTKVTIPLNHSGAPRQGQQHPNIRHETTGAPAMSSASCSLGQLSANT